MEKILNFLVGGLTGDMIHSLSACKNICLKENAKANLYITDGYHADPFKYGVEKTYEDTYDLIISQNYINEFKILKGSIEQPYINLNSWRTLVHSTYASKGCYEKCWTDLMAGQFDYPIAEYKWLYAPPMNETTTGRILIHRSKQRHNKKYSEFIKTLSEKPLFITCNPDEYNSYEFKDLAEPYFVSTITEMAVAIRSCKLFIGNQSAPFAIASALDVERICELDSIDYPFYKGEKKYSNKINFIDE